MVMIFILRTLFNLLLVVSLAATPLGAALASVNAGHDMSMHNSTDAEPCHEGMDEQALAPLPNNLPHDSSMTGPCNCCGIDCDCPDSAGCHNVVTPLVFALPGILLAVQVQSRDVFAAGFQDDYLSLIPLLDPPPPLV